jgi:hypothetical protein
LSDFRFVLAASAFGPEGIEDLGELWMQRLAVVAKRDFGAEHAATPEAWCQSWAKQLRESPDLIGFEIYDVLEDTPEGQPSTRFKLIYMPWSDSGTLFFADGAAEAGLALWPDGFRPVRGIQLASGLDAESLTRAFQKRQR